MLRLLAIVPTEEEEGGEEEAAAAAAAEAVEAVEQPQLGSASAVVYMCYMERGGEEAFFAAASARGVLCDRPKLSAQVRKRAFFAPLYAINNHFTKTGSGQTQGQLKKRVAFSLRPGVEGTLRRDLRDLQVRRRRRRKNAEAKASF